MVNKISLTIKGQEEEINKSSSDVIYFIIITNVLKKNILGTVYLLVYKIIKIIIRIL